MKNDVPMVDCPFIPATPDPENHNRIECVVKCNPFEIEVLHNCEHCGFNPKAAAERTATGKLVKGKDGLRRLVW